MTISDSKVGCYGCLFRAQKRVLFRSSFCTQIWSGIRPHFSAPKNDCFFVIFWSFFGHFFDFFGKFWPIYEVVGRSRDLASRKKSPKMPSKRRFSIFTCIHAEKRPNFSKNPNLAGGWTKSRFLAKNRYFFSLAGGWTKSGKNPKIWAKLPQNRDFPKMAHFLVIFLAIFWALIFWPIF